MNNNVNNNAVNQNPAFQDAEYWLFRDFADAHQEGVRVQIDSRDNSRLIVADRTASQLSRALKTRSSAEARAANNDVRTKLVKMVMRLCGVSDFNALDRTILAQFSGTKEHYTGLGSDMALEGTGEQTAATSGRPLSVRRITAILTATTEWLANNPVAPGPGQAQPREGQAQPRESMLKIETVVTNLRGADKEFSSLPTFDLETSVRIKGLFTVLLDRIKSLKVQTDQGALWTLLHEFLHAVESEIASGDENKDAGLMMRFKREVFAQLEARNAELSEEGKSLYSNDGFTELKLALESFGAKWKPDNGTLFESLAPNGQDKAFLENCTTKQAQEVNKLLTALKTLPAGFENSSGLRKRLLGRLQDALAWMQRNLAADAPITVGTWLQAFGFDEVEAAGQKTLAQALLDAELTKVNITKFNDLAPEGTNADFLKTCPSKQALAVNKLLTGLENLPNDIANGEELKSRLLGRLQDALAWMQHNLAADAPISVKTWLQAFGLPEVEGAGQKTLVLALMDAELEKVRTENVDKFKALVPAGANADFLKESPGDQVLAINKLLTDLANLPNDIANGEELRSRLLGRLQNAQTWMSNSGNRAANDLITVKTWLQAFGLPEGEGVEQKTLVQALLDGELANVRAENIKLFKKLAPGVKNTAFLENLNFSLAQEVNKFLTALEMVSGDKILYDTESYRISNGPDVNTLLGGLENALNWINENQPNGTISREAWWKAFGFKGNPPNENISSDDFARKIRFASYVSHCRQQIEAFFSEDAMKKYRPQVLKWMMEWNTTMDKEYLEGLEDDLVLCVHDLIMGLDPSQVRDYLIRDDILDGSAKRLEEGQSLIFATLKSAIESLRNRKGGVNGPISYQDWWKALGCRGKSPVQSGKRGEFGAVLLHNRMVEVRNTEKYHKMVVKASAQTLKKRVSNADYESLMADNGKMIHLESVNVLNGLELALQGGFSSDDPTDLEIRQNQDALMKRLVPKVMKQVSEIVSAAQNEEEDNDPFTMKLLWSKLGFSEEMPLVKKWADFGAAVLRAEYESMKKEGAK